MQLHLKEWEELPSTLRSIENEEDRKEVIEKLIAQYPAIEGMLDSLTWMRALATENRHGSPPELNVPIIPWWFLRELILLGVYIGKGGPRRNTDQCDRICAVLCDITLPC